MDIKMTMDGLDDLRKAFEKASEETREKVYKVVEASTMRVWGSAKNRIQRGPKTGTVYYRIPGDNYMTVRAGSADGPPVAFIPGGGSHNLSPVHQASKPGEAPATDSGNLANSIFWKAEKGEGYVFTNEKYGAYLEFGTSQMEPRPFLFPSMEEQAPQFKRELSEVLK